MPESILIRRLLLPELHLANASQRPGRRTLVIHAEKRSAMEVCPRCANPSRSTYDHRTVSLHDAPVRGLNVRLEVKKRRFFCRPCQLPFTEPIQGVRKGYRTTERFRRSLLWACENFSDLSAVRRAYRCSSGYVYRALYHQLELERRKHTHPWPRVVGIDEHFFRRERRFRQFVSMIVDYRNSRLMELVEGKTSAELQAALAYIPGRENVEHVVLDLCDPFKNFARAFFPKASLVADKFHVLRLLSPAINRRRREITGDRHSAVLRGLLLRNRRRLKQSQRWALDRWLDQHPELRELYACKEALHALYRVRGHKRAATALTRLTDAMALSKLPEVRTLRGTLVRWRAEILAYFETGFTNGRVEGLNLKAKLVKRRAYGYRSFKNYRLRLLNACS